VCSRLSRVPPTSRRSGSVRSCFLPCALPSFSSPHSALSQSPAGSPTSTPTTPSPSTLSRPVRPFRRVSLIYLSPLTLFICRADSLDSFSPEVCLPRSLLPCFDCVDETSPLRRPSVRVSLRLSALLVVRELRRRRLRRRSKFRSSRVSRRRSRLKPVVGWGPSGGIELRRTTRKG
jgi:hypothetical protein